MSLNEPHAMSGADLSPHRRSRSRTLGAVVELVVIGLLTELVYLAFSLGFPLVSNTQDATKIFDVEILSRDRPWLAVVYFGGLCLLFLLFWRVLRLAQCGRR